ncbi:MAG: hypothetical protein EOO24_08860 [Comamonadaceae bacterium]|nr:MAG: hypothetical protein EOO24_08860 [Comamonadaceae bacterium]
MIRTSTHIALLLAAGAVLAGCASGHRNPVDPVSNTGRLDFHDVQARRPDFSEPFLRDGVIREPGRLRQIAAGAPQARVLALLGEPLSQSPGRNGPEWEYTLKLAMPQTGHFMVCQYKVLLDGETQTVRDAVWRRQQCQDIVRGA